MSLNQEFSHFWYCPDDHNILQVRHSRVAHTPYFVIARGKVAIGVNNAIAMKKIPQEADDHTTRMVELIFENHPSRETVELVSVNCKQCRKWLAAPKGVTLDLLSKKRSFKVFDANILASKPKLPKGKENWRENLECYWFCPKCHGLLHPKKKGKFALNKNNIDLGVGAAIKGGKITDKASKRAVTLAHEYFYESGLDQVQLQGVQCSNEECHLETVTLTLAFRYNDFIKKRKSLSRKEQLELYQERCGKTNFCEACGQKFLQQLLFCPKCGYEKSEIAKRGKS